MLCECLRQPGPGAEDRGHARTGAAVAAGPVPEYWDAARLQGHNLIINLVLPFLVIQIFNHFGLDHLDSIYLQEFKTFNIYIAGISFNEFIYDDITKIWNAALSIVQQMTKIQLCKLHSHLDNWTFLIITFIVFGHTRDMRVWDLRSNVFKFTVQFYFNDLSLSIRIFLNRSFLS